MSKITDNAFLFQKTVYTQSGTNVKAASVTLITVKNRWSRQLKGGCRNERYGDYEHRADDSRR